MTKWILAWVVIVTTITGAAQQRNEVKISLDFPVPAWPTNGVIPPELKSHFVFVDILKNEYIVAYPENLGSPDFEKDGPAERRITRYPLQRDVEPKITVVLTAVPGGKYKYEYAVSNGQNAKQPIDQWLLVLPEDEGNSIIKQPAGWFGAVQKGRTLSVANPDWIQSGAAAVLSVEKLEEQIRPGGLKVGFELESDLKPGFTLGFFRQAESVDALVQTSGHIPVIVVRNATPPPPPDGVPPPGGGGAGGGQPPTAATSAWQPIKDDIDRLLRFEYNSKTLLALAPKFDKSASLQTIAADFMRGVTVLSRMGTLTADSQFVKNTLSDLDGFVRSGGSGQLKLSTQPSGETETEIYNALKLSLPFN